MDFQSAIAEQAKNAKGLRKRQLERLAANPKACAALERRIREKAGIRPSDKVDYGAVDWAVILPLILELLPVILALFKRD